jgi:hypothetical protein
VWNWWCSGRNTFWPVKKLADGPTLCTCAGRGRAQEVGDETLHRTIDSPQALRVNISPMKFCDHTDTNVLSPEYGGSTFLRNDGILSAYEYIRRHSPWYQQRYLRRENLKSHNVNRECNPKQEIWWNTAASYDNNLKQLMARREYNFGETIHWTPARKSKDKKKRVSFFWSKTGDLSSLLMMITFSDRVYPRRPNSTGSAWFMYYSNINRFWPSMRTTELRNEEEPSKWICLLPASYAPLLQSFPVRD